MKSIRVNLPEGGQLGIASIRYEEQALRNLRAQRGKRLPLMRPGETEIIGHATLMGAGEDRNGAFVVLGMPGNLAHLDPPDVNVVLDIEITSFEGLRTR